MMLDQVTERLADRLARIRSDRGLSLDQLAEASGVSRATLSRLEKAETSPTADVLAKLCAAYGFSMSQLLAMVEDGFAAHVRRTDQAVWRDGGQGFTRRVASPAGGGLAGEVLDCKLAAGTEIFYETPPVAGQEHHLVMLSGQMRVEVDGVAHDLDPGDTLRYRLHGPSRFVTQGSVAKYLMVLVTP